MSDAINGNRLVHGAPSTTAVGNWLMVGVAMVIMQIVIGGITRLTGSGLSITEWEVVTGTLPPFGQAQWLAAFAKYKTTPQFQLLNADFSLSDFKFIFFWEWLHRLWARLIGLVFAGGFIYFLVKKKFSPTMVVPLVVLFLLGALQGLVGWIMVASGLVGDAIYVKPTRLALHFVFALSLLAYTWWFALKLKVPNPVGQPSRSISRWSVVALVLLALQLLYGALMAGNKAASAAPTWPLINGSLLQPAGLYVEQHGLYNFLDNKVMVHFMHRGLAYLLFIALIVLSVVSKKGAGTVASRWWLPAMFGLFQVLLGIGSVISSATLTSGVWGGFEWFAQLHQIGGILLVGCLVFWLYYSSHAQMLNKSRPPMS